jgi:uncharacterized protein (DUF885 family)
MNLLKATLIALICCIFTTLLFCTQEKKLTESARLDKWFHEKWERDILEIPEFLTTIGRKERKGDLDDISEEKALKDLEKARKDLEELSAFDTSLLDKQGLLSWKLYKDIIEEKLELEEFRHYNYPVNQMCGVHQNLPSFMINRHTVKNLEDAQAYVSRLKAFKKKFEQEIDNLKIRKKKGIIPPRFVFPFVLESCRNVIGDTTQPDSNILIIDLTKKIDSLSLDDTIRNALLQDAKGALAQKVIPAYRSLIDYMKELEPGATDTVGIWQYENGDRAYQVKLKRTTTTDLTPEEIFQLGLVEVERIHGEMRKIMDQVNFKGDLKKFFGFMLEDGQFYYKNTVEQKEQMIRDFTTIIDSMYTRLPSMFATLPKGKMIVRAVEPYREKAAGVAFYNMGAPDGSRPGTFYANAYKVRDMPKYEMEALAFHEGIPGHHMQIAIAQEMKGVPEFRKYKWYTAYGEGWALYTEYLGRELGFYKDPYSDFGRLSMELWRACRLVVDAGIHYKRWTKEKAVQYLVDNTPSSVEACTKAIERYIIIPSQATAYKIGMIEILKIREWARKAMGEKFDIRAFHDIILQSGCVPLSIVKERVKEWAEG